MSDRQQISHTFNEDCMVGMARYPDGFFDLAVVDPPYQVDWSGGKAKKNGFKSRAHWDKMCHGWDKQRPGPEYFAELFRVSKNQIIWGANYFAEHLPPSMGWVFWYKMQDNFSFSDGEIAFTSFDCKTRIFKYARGMESGFAPGGESAPNIHPTQKPVALYKWLLQNYAKPGDKILDTHLGSGSSRIAAYDMGFDFYAWELDKDYFDAQEARFKAHIAKPQLFAPAEQYQPTQTQIFQPA